MRGQPRATAPPGSPGVHSSSFEGVGLGVEVGHVGVGGGELLDPALFQAQLGQQVGDHLDRIGVDFFLRRCGHGVTIFDERAELGGMSRYGIPGYRMPRDVMERIFEPYFTTRPRGEGVGLGLALSRRIIEAHGGTIEARNTGAERGVAFSLLLPLASS